MPKRTDPLIQEILRQVHEDGKHYLLEYKPQTIVQVIPELEATYSLDIPNERKKFATFWCKLKSRERKIMSKNGASPARPHLHVAAFAKTPATPFPGVESPGTQYQRILQIERMRHEFDMDKETNRHYHEVKMAALANYGSAIKCNEKAIEMTRSLVHSPQPSQTTTRRLFDQDQYVCLAFIVVFSCRVALNLKLTNSICFLFHAQVSSSEARPAFQIRAFRGLSNRP